MASLSDIERFGFLADDIKSFLATYDIHINCGEDPESRSDTPPSETVIDPLDLLDKSSTTNIAEKPLATTERNTLLTIIASLCKEAKLDHTKHAKTAGLIQSTAASMGLSIGETTIEGHLKRIPNALAGRMR